MLIKNNLNKFHFLSELSTTTYISAIILILISLTTSINTDYFADELYFIACSKRPALGYVDHPPLTPLVISVWSNLFGYSLIRLRFLAGLLGAMVILNTALITRMLGGNKFAQSLTSLLIISSSIFTGLYSFFSMNSIEILLFSIITLLFIRLIQTNLVKFWFIIGLFFGIGLLNKYTIGFYGICIIVGLLLTQQRKWFATIWPYLSIATAFILFLPHLIWQGLNNWPTLIFLKNKQAFFYAHYNFLQALKTIIILYNPFSILIAIVGLYHLFTCKKFTLRFLGISQLLFILISLLYGPSVHYLAPSFPLLFACGAVSTQNFLSKFKPVWPKRILIILIITGGIILIPLTAPFLPIKYSTRYFNTFSYWKSLALQKNRDSNMPFLLRLYFGWKEFANKTKEVLKNLPNTQRHYAILTNHYSDAAALEFYGRKLNLPPVFCSHNSFWLWGNIPHSYTSFVAFGFKKNKLVHYFKNVTFLGDFKHPYSIYSRPFYFCQNPTKSFNTIWTDLKHYD